MSAAVFIDRDGVLNAAVFYADTGEHESPRTAEDLCLLPDVLPALQTLQAAGWSLFLVSNQPSYAKGKVSLDDLRDVHEALAAQIEAAGVHFKAYYYSYTHPNGVVAEYTTESLYRKPNPGFLLDARRDFGISLIDSWMVGDRDSDVFCGQRAGCKTAQVRYPLSAEKQGQARPDRTCHDFPDFVTKICGGT